MKPPIPTTQGQFAVLEIDEMDTEIDQDMDLGHSSSTTEETTRDTRRGERLNSCLISHLFKSIILAKRFISKLREQVMKKTGKRLIMSARVPNEVMVKVGLKTMDTARVMDVEALLDCGATGLFIDREFAEGSNLTMNELPRAVPVYNVDGTPNLAGPITHQVSLFITIKGHREKATFEVCNLGKAFLILGLPWLRKHNPEIDWSNGEVKFTRCPRECNRYEKVRRLKRRAKEGNQGRDMEEEMNEEEEELMSEEDYMHVRGLVKDTKIKGKELAENQGKTVEEMVPERFHAYLKVFSEEESRRMPTRKPWDHAIDLTEDFVPRKAKIIPQSRQEQEVLDKQLNDWLERGYIRPTKSPQTSSVFYAYNPKMRMVTDYRPLNKHTIKNAYPLPLISDVIDKIGEAKVFTKMDVQWGFNNVWIKEGDEWKAAFATNRGSFEPTVMFFGLTNSPATFQTMMNEIFRDLIDKNLMVVFIDDILIYTKTKKGHKEIVEEVLKRLLENDLYLKPEKCCFEVDKVDFLGLVIGPEGISMDESKKTAITEWPEPRNVKDVRRFLGLANFYRRFIEQFAKHAGPLNNLLRKETTWRWTEVEKEAMNEIKRRITSDPILVNVDPTLPLRLECDASNFATGAILSMKCSDGHWRPCAFLSKGLSDVERNYDVHDKEMLGIIRALDMWRHHLEGAKHKFEIWTDHRNLKYFMEAKKLNRRQARWSLFLSRFDFELIHKAGSLMGKADSLSRRPDHEKGVEHDNEDVTLLKPEFFRIQALRQGHDVGTQDETDILKRVRKSRDWDEAVVKAVEELRRSPTKRLRSEEWAEEQGLILFQGKVYIPKDMDLRRRIVKLCHETPVAGHPGQWKTLELVTRNYWWPGMTKYIVAYVKGCDRCQRYKNYPMAPAGKLKPLEIPKGPWKSVTADFIVKLPEAQGYNAILVTVCRGTKQAHFIPTVEETSARGTAVLYRDNVWKLHGLPEEIITDKDPRFASDFIKELNTILGIKTKISTPYHPQTDGQTERVNQELEQYLRLFIERRQEDWPEWLALAEFAYNNKVHTSTRVSPFFANYGYHPRMGFEPRRQTKVEEAGEFAERMRKIHEETKAALSKAQEAMKRYADIERSEAPKYKIGDKVMIVTSNLSLNRPSRKLAERAIGPYPIIEIFPPNAVKVKLPRGAWIDLRVNVSRLQPYNEPTIPGQRNPTSPPIEVTQDGNRYEVEAIIDSRIRRGRLEYLVQWKGFTEDHNTWEPTANVDRSPGAIKDFYQKHPGAPRLIQMTVFNNLTFKPYENYTVLNRPSPPSRLDKPIQP